MMPGLATAASVVLSTQDTGFEAFQPLCVAYLYQEGYECWVFLAHHRLGLRETQTWEVGANWSLETPADLRPT